MGSFCCGFDQLLAASRSAIKHTITRIGSRAHRVGANNGLLGGTLSSACRRAMRLPPTVNTDVRRDAAICARVQWNMVTKCACLILQLELSDK
jgi:hypothetical protein